MSMNSNDQQVSWQVDTAGTTPLWKQCASHIEALVRSGELSPGQVLPPHSELAELVGVGASTLQKALVWLTGEGLLVRHRNRGTFVAEQPGRRNEGWIAVMTRAMFDPDLSQWDLLGSRAVVNVLSDANAPFRFYNNAYMRTGPDALQQEIDPRLSEDVAAGLVRGLLVIGAVPASNPEFRAELKRARVPIVETSEQGHQTPYVVEFDRPAFVRQATEQAAARGCRRLTLLETPGFEPIGRDLLAETFQAEVARLGLSVASPCVHRIAWPPNAAQGAEAFDAIWRGGGPRPDGLVITDEYVALGAAEAAVAAGVAVPETLWMVTSITTGTEMAYPCRMDTIEFDPVELIDHAWQMLRARIEGQVIHKRQVRVVPHQNNAATDRLAASHRPIKEEVCQ